MLADLIYLVPICLCGLVIIKILDCCIGCRPRSTKRITNDLNYHPQLVQECCIFQKEKGVKVVSRLRRNPQFTTSDVLHECKVENDYDSFQEHGIPTSVDDLRNTKKYPNVVNNKDIDLSGVDILSLPVVRKWVKGRCSGCSIHKSALPKMDGGNGILIKVNPHSLDLVINNGNNNNDRITKNIYVLVNSHTVRPPKYNSGNDFEVDVKFSIEISKLWSVGTISRKAFMDEYGKNKTFLALDGKGKEEYLSLQLKVIKRYPTCDIAICQVDLPNRRWETDKVRLYEWLVRTAQIYTAGDFGEWERGYATMIGIFLPGPTATILFHGGSIDTFDSLAYFDHYSSVVQHGFQSVVAAKPKELMIPAKIKMKWEVQCQLVWATIWSWVCGAICCIEWLYCAYYCCCIQNLKPYCIDPCICCGSGCCCGTYECGSCNNSFIVGKSDNAASLSGSRLHQNGKIVAMLHAQLGPKIADEDESVVFISGMAIQQKIREFEESL